jgi:negative regulator of flagellin synthesis FlgM
MVVIIMKVTGSQFQQVLKTYQKNRPQKVGASEVVKASDKVNLSKEAKEITRMNEILAQTPDVRADKVAQLRQAVQQGSYEVHGSKIAEKIYEKHLLDKIVK